MASQGDGVPGSAKKAATQYPWNRVVLTPKRWDTSNLVLIAIPAASHKRKTAPLLPGKGRENQIVGVSLQIEPACVKQESQLSTSAACLGRRDAT